MQRHAQRILLDRLLVRAAVAKIPLEQLLTDKEREKLTKTQKKITPDTKIEIISDIGDIIEKLKGLNTPEVAAKITASFKNEGALAQKEALKIIYPQDPKLVIPVIANIIEDLLTTVMKRNPLSPGTIEFLKAALAKVKEVDEKQNWNKLTQVSLIKELRKEKIGMDMAPVFTAISKMTFLEDETLKWFEAIVWIEGHFLREHMKALAKGGGKLTFIPEDPEVVSPIDEEDETICYGKGVPVWEGNKVTKHFINSHFHAVAVLLEQKAKMDLKLGFATIDVFPTKFVQEYGIKETVASEPEKKEDKKSEFERSVAPIITIPSSAFAYDTKKTPDGRWLQLTTHVPADSPPERIAEGMRFFAKVINGEKIQLTHSPRRNGLLLEKLKRISKQPNVELFSLMKDAFGGCILTGEEDRIIHNYVATMTVHVIDNYVNSKTTASGMWPAMPYKDRGSKELVDTMFTNIKTPDEKGKRKTALEVIELIEKAWLDNKEKPKPSAKLSLVLESLIKNVCEHFITELLEEQQPKAIAEKK